MSDNPLWSIDELVAATGGMLDGEQIAASVIGVSIDTRTIAVGDLFVALKDVRDGHDFVSSAFAKGAAMALVAKDYQKKPDDGLSLRVDDPLAGLEKIAVAARARLNDKARLIAVTGSAGKTTTKEMLRLGFAHLGRVHASQKSYNNHWGVPLTLARMPRDTDFAVIEIGMNHAGEITPLTKMARPHVAVVTSVLPVHLEHFSGLEDIAKAKAEIFAGLDEEAGWAVIPADAEVGPLRILAEQACAAVGERFEHFVNYSTQHVISFGERDDAWIRIDEIDLKLKGSTVKLSLSSEEQLTFEVGLPGRHNVLNSVACVTAYLCATDGLELPRQQGETYAGCNGLLSALARMQMDPVGRGQVFELAGKHLPALTLIDESYNANPASMRAAFENLSLYRGDRRKVAVIGDMLELGNSADDLHAALVDPLQEAGIDLVFACGSHMKALYDILPEQMRGGFAQNSKDLKPILLGALQTHDIVMIKGSNGSRLGLLVEAMKTDLSPQGES